jgi:hypothetical protein
MFPRLPTFFTLDYRFPALRKRLALLDDGASCAGEADLAVLTTEHFTLQSARQLCLQDMQGGGSFVFFVLALLSSLWVLGVFTFVRVLHSLACTQTR